MSGGSLRERLSRARASIGGAVAGVRGRGGIDDGTWEGLEATLLRADLGVRTTGAVLARCRDAVAAREVRSPEDLAARLRTELAALLVDAPRALATDAAPGSPCVWLVVGVNGAGKTTTIGKLASRERAAGRGVVLAAGDTFRAAAGDQIAAWAQRAGAELVRGAEGADPSSVVFDAVQRAAARGAELVIADTAGRLQANTNLMEELRKVRRVADKAAGVVREVLLVVDATTGQNGLAQAREFAAATGVTGVVLTKLDGSAKGGIVFAIEAELGIPVKLVGLGEGIDDLAPFAPADFVAALLDD
ncbi:MAG: signal recognition particle-docking protein FtsY [Ilumatobacteraceae bacterium]